MGRFIDVSGQTFNRLSVIRRVENKNGKAMWLCKCICGNEVVVSGEALRSGNTKSCGCLNDEKRRERHPRKHMEGQKFGRLTAMYRVKSNRGWYDAYHCVCDCGNECDVATGALGRTTFSCGCLQKEAAVNVRKDYLDATKDDANRWKLFDDYAECLLANGMTFFVDLDDYEKVKEFRWYSDGKYIRNSDKVRLHRYILNEPEKFVDHIDGNPMNNRKSNLRLCTCAQNLYNKPAQSNNTSGKKGVFKLQEGRYRSSIGFHGHTIYLGTYDDIDEAAMAYDRKAIELFGEFARTNFPRENYEKEVENQ